LGILDQVVRSSTRDHGWRRPSWTRELLVETMVHRIGIRIHVATMSRALALIKAHRGKPRPRVKCPWHPAAKTRRLNQIARLVASLPKNEVAVYEDEVDVHLNPKIGLDWMGLGQQKDVMTPGQNEKRYLAGALDVRTKEIHWVEATKKDAWLFLDLLKKLTVVYHYAKVIHVILDNYKIHKSQIISIALTHFAKRVRLHFLPPYCPDYNQIERAWQDLHAHVTRNHQCLSMMELMGEVRYYLRKRNRRIGRRTFTTTAA
jgi:transposase